MKDFTELIEEIKILERKKIALKLVRRATHLLGRCCDPDSPIILVATELKIQAEEIYEDSLNLKQETSQ